MPASWLGGRQGAIGSAGLGEGWMRYLVAAMSVLLASAASAQGVGTSQQWVAGTIRVPDYASVIAHFELERDSGSDAALLSEALAVIGDSADALTDELDVLGTSPNEQEATYFGDPAGSDLTLGVLTGLTAGQQYQLTFAWSAGAPPLPQDDYRAFPLTPIRDIGSPSIQRLFTAQFIAPAGRTPFQFFLLDRPGGLPDNLQLSQIDLAAVPEPASWAFMIAGFGMLGCATRWGSRPVRVSIDRAI